MTTQLTNVLTKERWLQHISHARSIKDSTDLDTNVLQEIQSMRYEEEITSALLAAMDDDWAFFESLEFTQHDDVTYSICKDCNNVKLLYKMSYMFGDSKRWELYNCLDCLASNMIRRTTYSHNWWQMRHGQSAIHYLSYLLKVQDNLDMLSSDRERCTVCTNYVLHETDIVQEGTGIRYMTMVKENSLGTLVLSHKDLTEVVVTHKRCSQKCDWGDHVIAKHYRIDGESFYPDNIFRFRGHGSELPHFDGKTVCGHCFNNDEQFKNKDDFDLCGCDKIDYVDEFRWSDYRDCNLCDDCYSTPVECGDCGDEWYEDDGHSCDEYQSDEPSNPWIRSYGYKPKPTFFGGGNCYLGIELEVEMKGTDIDEAAEYVWKTVDDRAYLKYDGSLQCGFEIVSHPHSLAEMQYRFPWQILSKLIQMGVRSWDTRSCGIHVHISKKAFNDEAHQIRFTKLIYDNQRQVQRIAGRASSYASFSDKGNVIRKVKSHTQSEGRYSAVNVEPASTIEVRVFKGSLRKERVLSSVEFVHAVYSYTKNLKMVPKDKPLSWAKFVGFVSQNSQTYPNLFTIINESFERDSITEQEEE